MSNLEMGNVEAGIVELAESGELVDLSATLDDQIAVLTLNRPENLNAFSGAMGRSLTAALRVCDADDDVRVVVITGAGRAFCAGADFSGGAGVFGTPDRTGDKKPPFSSDPLDDFHPWDVRKPVIAAINGHAVGIGLTMTLQCDIRIVADEAKLGIVQVRRGIMADLHSHWTLPRLVGYARAADLILTGRMFNGTEAVQWGLASSCAPAAEVLSQSLELARELATHTAPLSAGISKRLLWMSAPTPEEINTLERELHLHLMGTADSKEGVMSFMEKRDPNWTLRISRDWPEWFK
ncbi:MAG: enoyl-CoA hydratase-related protein [Acidimicrobiaceae bacterium]|nr:enoyl-CoA hydratase-related protein [Acidimicrobiaceae bacterium]